MDLAQDDRTDDDAAAAAAEEADFRTNAWSNLVNFHSYDFLCKSRKSREIELTGKCRVVASLTIAIELLVVMEYYSIFLIIRISNKIRILAGIIQIIWTSTIH